MANIRTKASKYISPRSYGYGPSDNAEFEKLEDKANVLKYMRGYKVPGVCCGGIFDVYKNDYTGIYMALHDDGEFAWNEATIYYFENYDVKLQPEFLEKVRKTI